MGFLGLMSTSCVVSVPASPPTQLDPSPNPSYCTPPINSGPIKAQEVSAEELTCVPAIIIVDLESGLIDMICLEPNSEKVAELMSSPRYSGKLVIEDHKNNVIMPGLVDAKAHFGEPGIPVGGNGKSVRRRRTSLTGGSSDEDEPSSSLLSSSREASGDVHCWEGFVHGTRAAAAGGVTTVMDFPDHGHATPIADRASLIRKMDLSRGKLHVDVGFYALATPDNIASTEPEKSILGMLASGAMGVVGHQTR